MSAVTLAVCAGLLTSGPAPAVSQRPLDSASGVAALQVGLRGRGTYRGAIDGIFGPATRSALIEFQRRAGLFPTGIFDARTRGALGPYARHRPGTRLLRAGASGWDVVALRFRLAWAGFPSARFDARFDGHLDGALRAFEVFAGQPADGIAGAAVLAALRRPAPRSPIRLSRPLQGPVGDRFGPRGDRFHAGIDIPAPLGVVARSAAPGRVTFSGWGGGGFGNLVVIAHNGGVTTIYAHLARLSMRVGDSVGTGQVVGEVGATGDATGPHLHFEVRVRGAAIDPLGAL